MKIIQITDTVGNNYIIKNNNPLYIKINGIYGYLVVIGDKISFITADREDVQCEELVNWKIKHIK